MEGMLSDCGRLALLSHLAICPVDLWVVIGSLVSTSCFFYRWRAQSEAHVKARPTGGRTRRRGAATG
jgi:hypothetical protein